MFASFFSSFDINAFAVMASIYAVSMILCRVFMKDMIKFFMQGSQKAIVLKSVIAGLSGLIVWGMCLYYFTSETAVLWVAGSIVELIAARIYREENIKAAVQACDEVYAIDIKARG